MPKIQYVTKDLSQKTLDVIGQANRFIESYQAQGFNLTLRQIYYQFVAHDIFPDDRRWSWNGSKWVRDPNGTKNADPNYKWLGGIVSDGRLAGLIDWGAIEDRGRSVNSISSWDSPSDIIDSAARWYAKDLWADQPYRPEIWVEKEALIGVVEDAARELACPSFACKGYTSQSAMWEAGTRFYDTIVGSGQTPVVIHLGDHDPSGIDMTRDIFDRLAMFAEQEIEVNRIALNMDQITKYAPPPNPTKLTDSRAKDYVRTFGNDSWELDALEPRVLKKLIQEAILSYQNEERFKAAKEEQEEERNLLEEAADNWESVEQMLKER